MKRLIIIAGLVLLLVALSIPSFASSKIAGQATSQTSTTLTASGQAVSGPAIYHGYTVVTDGTNNVTIQVYKGTAATSGNEIYPASIILSGTTRNHSHGFSPGIACSDGIYVTISVAGGGTASLKVNYDQ